MIFSFQLQYCNRKVSLSFVSNIDGKLFFITNDNICWINKWIETSKIRWFVWNKNNFIQANDKLAEISS